MSTDMMEIGKLRITRFYGGKSRGVCLQFTPLENCYSQLTRGQVKDLAKFLSDWGNDPMIEPLLPEDDR